MAARFGLTRIEVDEQLPLDPGATIADDAWRVAFQRSFRALHRALARGESVVWDSATLSHAQRRRISEIGQQYGHCVTLVFLDTPDNERMRRRDENRMTELRIDVPDAEFEQAARAFEPPQHNEPHVRWDGQGDPARWLEATLKPMISVVEMEP